MLGEVAGCLIRLAVSVMVCDPVILIMLGVRRGVWMKEPGVK